MNRWPELKTLLAAHIPLGESVPPAWPDREPETTFIQRGLLRVLQALPIEEQR